MDPMKLSASSCNRSAFTLIEVLVVLLIVGLLAALLLSVLGGLQTKGERSKAMANLRQIGLALHQFTADHQGRLPGPMWPGQIPVLDPQRNGRLVRELAPYLGLAASTNPASIFVPPAFPRAFRAVQPTASWNEARPFVLNMAAIPANDRDNTPPINPWGSLAETSTLPMQLAAVPSSAWALSDADQQHPRVRGAVWRAFTPAQPIHGNKRLALRFSGVVEALEEEDLR
jgi:prepilin-type N-terminal cleavage/methylation domain-containing protein